MEPFDVKLSPKMWALGRKIGTSRRKTNSGRRSNHDRGNKNDLYDTLGVVGELALFRWLKKEGVVISSQEIRKHLYNPKGGWAVKGPDGGGLDAKFFNLDQPVPVYAKINKRKHEQLAKGGECSAYFGVIGKADRELASAIVIPFEDIPEKWELRDFGYGDPCYTIDVAELITEDRLHEIRSS